MDVGKRITNLRATKGLTTTALAHKAGLAQSHLRDIELGNKNPTVETVSYICEALDISLAEFFSEELENSLAEDEVLRIIYRLSKPQKDALLLFLNSLLDK
jgi:transcriptional regulator with XRE-family HTH domain